MRTVLRARLALSRRQRPTSRRGCGRGDRDAAKLAYSAQVLAQYREDASKFPSSSQLGQFMRSPGAQQPAEVAALLRLVDAYRSRGHEVCGLDPLESTRPGQDPAGPLLPGMADLAGAREALDYKSYGFTDADLDRAFDVRAVAAAELGSADLASAELTSAEDELSPRLKSLGVLGHIGCLREVLATLRHAYCGSIGVEMAHVRDAASRAFMRERFEAAEAAESDADSDAERLRLTREERLRLLEDLTRAVRFEEALRSRWPTAKRFGLEGCESFVPGLSSLVDRLAGLGVEQVVIGMAHRGRLNVLANVLDADLPELFRKFDGLDAATLAAAAAHSRGEPVGVFTGDVKYHVGAQCARPAPGHSDFYYQSLCQTTPGHSQSQCGNLGAPIGEGPGPTVRVTLMPNPSHLEAVNPVVLGATRAAQHRAGDALGRRSAAVLVHGDAAVCGQGVVYEGMRMRGLPQYDTGGVVHIVLNNQIGYTTDPADGRSTRYCTDLAKAFDCPVLHVNADDVDAVAVACRVAAEYRQSLRRDVVVEIVGFRLLGHNEMDNPDFTQPATGDATRSRDASLAPECERNSRDSRSRVLEKHGRKCVATGLCSQAHLDAVREKVDAVFKQARLEATQPSGSASTSSSSSAISAVNEAPKVADHQDKCQGEVEDRGEEKDANGDARVAFLGRNSFLQLASDLGLADARRGPVQLQFNRVGWAGAEALALGFALAQGTHVRVSGHSDDAAAVGVLGARLEAVLAPYAGAGTDRTATVSTSWLGENSALGFEHGYAAEAPDTLVVWKAPLGDVCSGAQVVLDQFFSAGEAKWGSQCGLALIVPHAPTSSARLERFLLQVSEDPDCAPADAAAGLEGCNLQVCNVTTPAQTYHVLRRQAGMAQAQAQAQVLKPLVLVDGTSRRFPGGSSAATEFTGVSAGFRRVIPEQSPAVAAEGPGGVRVVVFCSGSVYFDLEQHRAVRSITDVAIVRIEQIAPFPFDAVAAIYAEYPHADVRFVQLEPKNMGSWSFCRRRFATVARSEAAFGVGKRPLRQRVPEYVGPLASNVAEPKGGWRALEAQRQDLLVQAFAETDEALAYVELADANELQRQVSVG